MLLESQSPEDMVQNLWVEVASINKACNDKLFPSKDVTARFIRTGEYINLLKELLPTLHLWRDRLDRSKGLLRSKAQSVYAKYLKWRNIQRFYSQSRSITFVSTRQPIITIKVNKERSLYEWSCSSGRHRAMDYKGWWE